MSIYSTRTVWTYPSGIEDIDETLYWACPELAPESEQKTAALKNGGMLVVPVRAVVKTPAVKDKDGKVTKPAVYEKDAKGEVVKEIVGVVEYKALVEAKVVEDAKKPPDWWPEGVRVEGEKLTRQFLT